jgi:Cu-Zn family superoxide dismutase
MPLSSRIRLPRTRPLLIAAAVGGAAGITVALVAPAAFASSHKAKATLLDASGAEVGKVRFTIKDDRTEIRVVVDHLPANSTLDAFHGFHIHANDDPANGEGCQVDPAAPPNAAFVSADGHWKSGEQVHSSHLGDMPSLLVDSAGRATLRFNTHRFDPAELEGRVVIVHAGPDNFGNVPVGAGSAQYTPNSDEALAATAKTGNAGDRLACGVIETG